MDKSKKIIMSVSGILLLMLISIGITYAIFTYTKQGNTDNTITTGKLTFLYTENTGTGTGINITNAFPVSDELGKAYSSDDQVFDFKVESEIVGDMSIPYEVTVGKTSTSTLGEEYIKLYLTDTTENTEVDLLEPTLYSELPESATEEDEKQIYFDEVEANEDYLKKFRLRMWIDESSNQEEINDKTFTVKVNVYSNEEVVKKEANLAKYTIVNDVNSNGTADVGDEIQVNGENFYVIKNDGTNIDALAKYNLNVGSNAKGTATGIQDREVSGLTEYGNVVFSDNSGWPYANNDDINIQDYEGPVKTAINNYKAVVTNASAVRLITKTELEGLGCSESEWSCENAPDWVYSTSYWTGSAYSGVVDSVWIVGANGFFTYSDFYGIDGSYGVRPVITIGA